MKLSRYAKQQSMSYSTALRGWLKASHPAPSGTIIVDPEANPPAREEKVVIYTRVCSAEHQENLECQVERVVQYCTVRGYQVAQVVKEIASGVTDSRPKLLALLKNRQATHIVVEHKDRITRFDFRYLEPLLELQGRTIEVVNVAENDTEDLIADLVAIVYRFTARLYGQRRAKRKTERIVQELQAEDTHEAG
jgi:predicted site-specific integrase-resolvase